MLIGSKPNPIPLSGIDIASDPALATAIGKRFLAEKNSSFSCDELQLDFGDASRRSYDHTR